MKTRSLGIVLVLVILGLAMPTMAGFVDSSCLMCFSDDPNLTKHSYNFDYIGEANFDAKVALHEGPIYQIGADPPLTCQGEITSDPILEIYEDVLNESSVTWTAWKLELDPNATATFVTTGIHTPTSDHFNSFTLINSKTLEFFAPNAVPVNDTVDLDFFINVPYTAGSGNQSFSFTLTQTAIPEPATLSLLVLGGLAMLRRGRKN